VFGGEAGAQLEQRLIVALEKLVHDRSPRGIGKSPVQVTHSGR
jgi:hypothetical protein